MPQRVAERDDDAVAGGAVLLERKLAAVADDSLRRGGGWLGECGCSSLLGAHGGLHGRKDSENGKGREQMKEF